MRLSSSPRRPVTRVRVNELPNVLSGRPSIPVARPFHPPPGFSGKAAAPADAWSALVDSVAPRKRHRRIQSRSSALLVSTAAAAFIGVALAAWSLSRPVPAPRVQPLVVAALAQDAPLRTALPEARDDSGRLEPDGTPEPLQPSKPVAPGLLAEPAPAMPVAMAAAGPARPVPPAPPPVLAVREARVIDKPAACAECKKGGSHGTSLEFADCPTEAAKQASKQNKLMFVVHISGNFEDDKFT